MQLTYISHVAAFFCIFQQNAHITFFPHKLAFLMAILIILIFFVFLFKSRCNLRIVYNVWSTNIGTHTHTHTNLTALFPWLPRWAGTRKVKPIWMLLKQETVSGSGINWTICKSAHRSRQITMPAPHHSVFYRPDALSATQPTLSKHWGHDINIGSNTEISTKTAFKS